MTLSNDGWVPGRTSDPNDANEGISVRTASNLEDADDELSAVLAQLNRLHQKAIELINDYTDRQKAKVASELSVLLADAAQNYQ